MNLALTKMDRILPEAASKVIAGLIENVYAYGPLAQKTVVLGKFFKKKTSTSEIQNTLYFIF